MSDTNTAQKLLAAIGFPIAVDGDWGGQSIAACKSFQRAWNPGCTAALGIDGDPGNLTMAALEASAGNRGVLSPHFHYYEFACNHGNCKHCHGWMEAPHELLQGAEILRTKLGGGGLEIVGPSRCDAHNRDPEVMGAANSLHLHRNGGNAFDVHPYWTWEQVRDAGCGFTGFETRKGHGDFTFHVDLSAGFTPQRPKVFNW